MATVKMKKMTLIGLKSERSGILKNLHKMKCVEISSTENLEKTDKYSDIYLKDEISTKLSKMSFFFGFLKDARIQATKLSERYKKLTEGKEPEISDPDEVKKALIEYKPEKKPFSVGLPAVIYDEFENIVKKEEELFEIILETEKINGKLIDIKSDMIRLNSLMEQLTPYLMIDAKFSAFHDTKNVAIMLGIVPNNKLPVVEALVTSFDETELNIYNSKKYSAIVTITSITQKESILTRLVEADYVPASFNFDMTAQDKYDECKEKYRSLEDEKEKIISDAMGYEKFVRDLEILYDYYLLELKKAEADEKFRFTGETFTMECWFPMEVEEDVINFLSKNYTVYTETREPYEDEVAPTLNRNGKIVSPYEDITNMYSVPSYREIDPNPFVAIFYFLFFGIMVSDAGYGIILAIGAYFLYRYAKPRKGEGKLLLVIAMGGVSTFIWGVMFGGWFGITWKPLLFNPMDDPLAMLGLSLGLGLFHIMFGMGIHAVALFREKKYADAIFNIFGWYTVFLGLGLYALSAVPGLSVMKNIGMIAAIIGVIGVFLGGGVGKKGIFGKIGGGLGNLYNVTGLLSDILSYSRLFGLGLATGVVGMVINQLATVAVGLLPFGLGYIIAIPILLGGHIFNIGINTLGAYVHNSRLMYIEFFSKFYTGSGHQFVPFGANTKYIYIDN